MRFAATFLVFLLVVGAVAASAYLLLPACGVTVGGARGYFCPAPEVMAAERRLDQLRAENTALLAAVSQLEGELAGRQCEVAAPPAAMPEAAMPEIDGEAWAERDVGLLEGCWKLDSAYSTRNETTGVVTRYTDWRLCFDGEGLGNEIMRATNGTTCEGAVGARFDEGTLRIEEGGNLTCSDGTFIYKRVASCELGADGAAQCGVAQPDVGSSDTVRLRRAEREP